MWFDVKLERAHYQEAWVRVEAESEYDAAHEAEGQEPGHWEYVTGVGAYGVPEAVFSKEAEID